MLNVLERIPHHLGNPLIFPDCRKLTRHFPAWATEANLPGRVTLHTLRHTCASRLVMAGVDLLRVRDLGGWGAQGGLAMVERYAHVVVGHKREAVEALARGERLERISPQAGGTQSGTDEKPAERATVAKAG